MDVTDVLAGEHGVFHLLVEQLDDAIDRCRTLGELRVAVEPLALSLLGHARVEEETLFQSYERATGTLGPLRCLRHEHEQMDRWIRALFRIPALDDDGALRLSLADGASARFLAGDVTIAKEGA